VRLRIRADVGGVHHLISVVVDSLKELDPVLKEFGVYLRNKAKERFRAEGPGWPQLAASTQERLAHTRTAKVTAFGKVRASSARSLVQRLQRVASRGRGAARALSLGQKSDKHYTALVRAIGAGQRAEEAAAAIGKLARAGRNLELVGHIRTFVPHREVKRLATALEKVVGKTQAQLRAGQRQSATHKLLGKIASSLQARVERGRLVVKSAIPWAGVHNEGGAAGHGAQEPARTFLELEDDDVTVFDLLLGDHLAKHGAKE